MAERVFTRYMTQSAIHPTATQPAGHTDAVVSLTDAHTYFCRKCDRWVQQPLAQFIAEDFGHLVATPAPALSDKDEDMARWYDDPEVVVDLLAWQAANPEPSDAELAELLLREQPGPAI